MVKVFKDDCNHPPEAYLGSDGKHDYYLYNEQGISICKRFGVDGAYETIAYSNSPELFIQTLTKIEKLYSNKLWRGITDDNNS
jgi:hypothetical protein